MDEPGRENLTDFFRYVAIKCIMDYLGRNIAFL